MAGAQFTTIQPMNAPLSGNTAFTLSGGSFDLTCTLKTCTFNGQSATSITVTGAALTGKVPQYSSGATTAVTIVYAGSGTCGGQTTSASIFSYDSPVIKSVTYGSKDTVGGNSITISGNNFLTTSLTVSIGSTSPSCASVVSFLSFKCAIPAFSLGSRQGLDIVVSINSVPTTLIKFAYDTPVLLNILPQIPALDGASPITVFGSNLEGTAPSSIKIGTLSCNNAQMVTPHKAFSCIPDVSMELVRTDQIIQVSLFSGTKVATSWTFQPADTLLQYSLQGLLQSFNLQFCQFFDIIFTDSLLSYSAVFVGTGLSIATAGQVSTFAVLLLDMFSVGNPQRSGCNRVVAVSGNFGVSNQLLTSSSVNNCRNGTYLLSYNVTKAGKFALSLLQIQGVCFSHVMFLYALFLLITR